MRKSKINLDDYSHEELEEIMLKPIANLTEMEVKIYKKIKFINWKAKKEGKPEVYSFKKKMVNKQEEKKQFVIPEVKTKVVSSWKVKANSLKMPNWVNPPVNIDEEDIIGTQCLVKCRNKINPVNIQRDPITNQSVVFVEDEKYTLNWQQAWWIRHYSPVVPLGTQEERVRVE